jgi:hypothetical protein
MQLFKKKPYIFPNKQNIGGVDDWLLAVGNHKKELLELADKVTHDCFHCWWFQFGGDSSNRACKKPGRLNLKGTSCWDWRVDPNARNRVSGIEGFVF